MKLEQSLQALNLPNTITSKWLTQLREPHRHYHTLTHIEHMLANMVYADASKEFIAAIWLHDIVYNPHASDNEEQSAHQAMVDLQDTVIGGGTVAQLILGTKHHEAAGDQQNAFNDLDLLILGESEERYRHYVQGIRMEYAHIPTASFKANRALFMERMLDRNQIYLTLPFQRYEEQARKNIAYELRELRL